MRESARHNYRVLVTLQGKELDATGLLLDFKLLKQVMRPVIDRLDHQMINDLEPFRAELNPSAENLARYFYDETNKQLSEMTAGRVRVKDCTLFETDTSQREVLRISAPGLTVNIFSLVDAVASAMQARR